MMLTVVLPAAALVFVIYRVIRSVYTQAVLPRLGKPGPIGYLSTGLQFILHSKELVEEGRKKFGGRPYILPSLAGSMVVLGPENVEILRASDDSIFNQPIAVNEGLQLDHTMNPQQITNPYQISVTRTDITRAVVSFIPDVLEETELAMQATFDPSNDSKPVSLPLFNTLTHMIGRISNRAVLGTELCRNDDFVNAIVHFAETLVLYARLLEWFPRFLRPATYFVVSSLFGGKKEPLKFIIPHLKQRLQEREETGKGPNDIAEFLIRNSGDEKLEGVAVRVMNLNFGSIHTSSIFLTHALFELSMLPTSDLDDIRTEVREALEMEGGWNKASLARFWRIDSLLREVGRVYGLSNLGMGRVTIREGTLADGTRIPAGYRVVLDMKAVHFNPEVYPNPDVFDAFRFSRARTEADGAVKDGFTTVSNNYLPFSAGRHACPGRFFAAMELKIMIAHLLLNYDFSLPPGVTERPENMYLSGGIIPNGKVELIFKRRPESGDHK